MALEDKREIAEKREAKRIEKKHKREKEWELLKLLCRSQFDTEKKPVGFWKNRCPHCLSKLILKNEQKRYWFSPVGMMSNKYRYYECSYQDCDYFWVK